MLCKQDKCRNYQASATKRSCYYEIGMRKGYFDMAISTIRIRVRRRKVLLKWLICPDKQEAEVSACSTKCRMVQEVSLSTGATLYRTSTTLAGEGVEWYDLAQPSC